MTKVKQIRRLPEETAWSSFGQENPFFSDRYCALAVHCPTSECGPYTAVVAQPRRDHSVPHPTPDTDWTDVDVAFDRARSSERLTCVGRARELSSDVIRLKPVGRTGTPLCNTRRVLKNRVGCRPVRVRSSPVGFSKTELLGSTHFLFAYERTKSDRAWTTHRCFTRFDGRAGDVNNMHFSGRRFPTCRMYTRTRVYV